jgi:hypothetical protein
VLAAEEPRVDRLRAQLKELVAFPDFQPLSDSVVAAIQDYQRYLGNTEGGFRWVLNPTQPTSRRWTCSLLHLVTLK